MRHVPTGWYMVGTCRAICTNHVPTGWYMSPYMYQPCTNGLVHLRRPMYQVYTSHVPTGWYMVGTCGAICTNHVPTGLYMSHYMYQPCTNPLVHLHRPTYKGYTLHLPTGWYMVGTCCPICTNHVPTGWYIYVDQCTSATRAMYQLVGTWLVHVATSWYMCWYMVGTYSATCTHHVPTSWYMARVALVHWST
jgi:hypothetical protein